MKKELIFAALSTGLFVISSLDTEVYAQGRGKGHDKQHKEGKKGGGPPPWAPANGYREKTRHVYFSQYKTYYDIQRGVYIYLNGGTWQVSASIPNFLQSVNLATATQIQLDLSTDTPQTFFEEHKKKYN